MIGVLFGYRLSQTGWFLPDDGRSEMPRKMGKDRKSCRSRTVVYFAHYCAYVLVYIYA